MPTLNWIGKDKIVNHHQEVPFRILEHRYGFTAERGKIQAETGSGNKIIQGDNLEALKSLLPQFENKIDCIYIDPPYNTGNEGWIYNDNVSHPRFRKWLGEVVGKEGDDLSRHDKWLCMMYPRIKLLHKLLSREGAIFISIDDNEKFHLKLLMDEVFGGKNFISDIAVVNNLKGRSDDKYIATAHESLLIYQKGEFQSFGVELPEDYSKEYKEKDKNGPYRLLGLRKRGSNSRRIDRPNLFYPVFYNEKTEALSLDEKLNWIKIVPKLSNGDEGNWRWGKETFLKRVAELEVRIVKRRNEYDVFQKDYLHKNGEEKRIKPKSFWSGSEFSSEAGTLQLKSILQNKDFPTPKSVDLIQYCLQQGMPKNGVVLDSFAGSGTTAHAAMRLNQKDDGARKFILIEMEDYAQSITAERVKTVIRGYSSGKNIFKGIREEFDFFELGKPLFDKNQNLNEKIGIERIRQYIWYSETRTAFLNSDNVSDSSFFLGEKDGTGYYFFYEPHQLTTLNYDTLGMIKTKAEQYIIYADNCLLPKDFLATHNIIFKKIPRDITRF